MRKKLKKRNSVSWVTYTVVLLIGLAMLYPIIWMFFATFKSNAEIFGSVKLLPSSFSFQSYIDGWHVNSKITYTTFFKNSFVMTIITTLFTILSSAIVAYGFARYQFPGKKILFGILIATLMLPGAVVMIPRYAMFNKLGLVDFLSTVISNNISVSLVPSVLAICAGFMSLFSATMGVVLPTF